MRSTIIPALAAVAALACGQAGEPIEPERTYSVQAGDTVELRTGESAVLGSGGARITFTGVASDSRCPVDVTCVWAGDAHVRLDATGADGGERVLDLHTAVPPLQADFAGFTIRLIDVLPARRQGDDLGPRDYSVRLTISRG